MQAFLNRIKGFITSNMDELIKPTVVLLCICIVIPLALAVTNAVTVKRIAKLENEAARQTMSKLVKADNFQQKGVEDGSFVYNEAKKNGKAVAYIFKTSAKGYGGDVTVMTAVSPDGYIIDLAVLDVQNETPGLGQNVTRESFYSQFIDRANKVDIKDIDTETGATFSSKAVMNAVNQALDNFKKLNIKPMANNETEVKLNEAE